MRNLILMAFLSITTILNANQTDYTVPLPICENKVKLFIGILDVQQRKVKIKENAPINEAIIRVKPDNGTAKTFTIKKGETCNLKSKFPSATKCTIRVVEPSNYKTDDIIVIIE